MHFRSVAEMNTAVVQWAETLPTDIDVIAGVPRSGMLPATLLALYLNVPLTDINGLREGRLLRGGARVVHTDDAALLEQPRTVLVVDDSIDSGGAMRRARADLVNLPTPHKVLYGAVYVSTRRAIGEIDTYAEILPRPRVFEWNILHHPRLSDACMDIDGVLCRDPSIDENDDGPAYVRFISTVPARYRPSTFVGHLVTARLEKYRIQTEAWLTRQSIQYGQLHMLAGATAHERREGRLHTSLKAAVYTATGAWLFIESSAREAHEIANISGRPVYCTDLRQMIYRGQTVGASAVPALRDRARWKLRDQFDQLVAKAGFRGK